MPTSVHIPSPLLRAIDRRARRVRVSRNRFIVQTLEKALAQESEWTPGFFDDLLRVEPGDAAAVNEMMRAIRARGGQGERRTTR